MSPGRVDRLVLTGLAAAVAAVAAAGFVGALPSQGAPARVERTDAVVYWMGRARRAEASLKDARAGLHLAQVAARDARLTARHQPSAVEAIRLASVVYTVPFSLLWRRAACESGPGPHAATPQPDDRAVDPLARNTETGTGEIAVGLFQFLGSTWRSTPFAGFPATSPYASAFAAAWMESVGRGGEWACQ